MNRASEKPFLWIVAGIPLARLNPIAFLVESNDPKVRGWGVAGREGDLFGVQDISLRGKSIDEVNENKKVRLDFEVIISGLEAGMYVITPYDTWCGNILGPFDIVCIAGQYCWIPFPAFEEDMAYKIIRQ